MYGHFHVILKDLVVAAAGMHKWASLLKEIGACTSGDDATVLDTVMHSDDLTIRLLQGACRMLELSADDGLRALGRRFIVCALRSKSVRSQLLRSQGLTFPEFLSNMNALHLSQERDHPNARFPSIHTRYDPASDELVLTYVSHRSGLANMLMGALQEAGRRLYGLDVTLVQIDVPADLRQAASEHRAASWRITWLPDPRGADPEASEDLELPSKPSETSFWAFHNAFVDVVRLLRSPELCCPACCSPSHVDDGEMVVASSGYSAKLLQAQKEEPGVPLERILFRGLPAKYIAAHWSDKFLSRCRSFWSKRGGGEQEYALSHDAQRVDVFVSHGWEPPENWRLVMGADADWAEMKSLSLAVAAKDIALERGEPEKWGDVTFWVDKACIPQDHPELKSMCVGVIEKFISQCDSVSILFTWSYLQRLWCVFEWSCILVEKDLAQVNLQNEKFVTESTMPMYIDAIRYFSLGRAKCLLDSDRAVLKGKLEKCYKSEEMFVRLVQASAIALMARSMAYRAGTKALRDTFFGPWLTLSVELHFYELAAALGECKSVRWREEASVPIMADGEGQRALNAVNTSQYNHDINKWFQDCVAPIVNEMREESLQR